MSVIETARARLFLSDRAALAFFATLAMHLVPVETKVFRTGATDGRHLYYNPDWVGRLLETQGMAAVQGFVLHEVLHCALGHIWRARGRVRRVWNEACDYAANAVLAEAGAELPDGALYDPLLAGMASEEIYAILMKVPRRPSSGQEWDDHAAWDGAECGGDEWVGRVAQAAQVFRSEAARRRFGSLPAGLERLIDRLLAPKISWRQLLAEYVQRGRFEYSWSEPDRRHVWREAYLPGYAGDRLDEAVVAVDTSGSVAQEEIDRFLAEVWGITQVSPATLHVVSCDAAVHSWQTFELGSDVPHPAAWGVRLRGGGGTDFRPLFEEVERRRVRPSVLVYLTDGCGTYPEKPPAYQVLWVVTPGGHQPPWGRVVKMVD